MRLAVFLLFSSLAAAQQSASTSAPCSPIAPHNSGSITINCPGMSKEQAQKMLAILNKILANQLDPDAVMAKLEEIQEAVSALRTLVDAESQSRSSELQKRFPGGFETFGVLTSGSATAGHTIVKTPTSYSIDVTWNSATIRDVTPASLTLELQGVRIERTELTPTGTQPAGAIQLNGSAIWQVDRRAKHVYINNGMAFWGYVLGGLVLSDTGDMLVVAVGLQRVES